VFLQRLRKTRAFDGLKQVKTSPLKALVFILIKADTRQCGDAMSLSEQ
jgi:hypothetical protein